MYESYAPYFYGTGRRKHSVARVRLYQGTGKVTVNGRDIDDYFGLETLKLIVRQPLNLCSVADSFDIVFFPVDSRTGNGYTRGARQFIGRFRTGLLVPMHFTSGGFESAWRMKEYADAAGIGFWSIGREGETLDV